MKVSEVAGILDAEIICGHEWMDMEVKSACGSDMMSDVLAFVKDQSVLLTGLCNPQVIRTAEMMDMKCIVFVRAKKPDNSIINLANEKKMVLMCSPHRMYSACGLLYSAGLGAGESKV